MKKILFMVSSMNIGGVEKSLLSLISVIPKEAYEITILVLEKKGGFLKDIPDYIKVEEASWYKKLKPIIMQPPQQTIKDYYKKKQYIKVLSFLSSYLRSKYFNNRYLYYKHVFKAVSENPDRYDIAISYQGPTDIIDYYVTHKVSAKRKVSWVHFDVSKHEINERLYKRLYKKFDKLFIVSKMAERRLLERIPSLVNKTEVFMNIISKEIIVNMSKKTVVFDEGYHGMRIVTVGRLSKEKGQDVAIKVLLRLRNDGYEVRWYCVGEGKQRTEYEHLIKRYDLIKDFILMGSTPNPYPFIAGSDIYVQPSRHEGYCLTLAEAKCLMKPIVTTDFTGAQEQIISGYNGLIVGFHEEELYKKIKYLIENPKHREGLANNLSETDIDTTSEVIKLLNYVD